MAGAKQPIEVVIANGKKHLTKAEIEKRKETEIKAPCQNVVAPEYLPTKLVIEFNELSHVLLSIGIMSDLDCDALARYLLAKQQYLLFTQKLSKATRENDWLSMEKLSALQDKAFRQCHLTASSLGLTISSRCKLTVPKVAEEKTNRFSDFANEED